MHEHLQMNHSRPLAHHSLFAICLLMKKGYDASAGSPLGPRLPWKLDAWWALFRFGVLSVRIRKEARELTLTVPDEAGRIQVIGSERSEQHCARAAAVRRHMLHSQRDVRRCRHPKLPLVACPTPQSTPFHHTQLDDWMLLQ